MKPNDHRNGTTTARRELFIILIIALASMILAVSLDAFDEFVRWYSLQGEPGVIEEVIVVIFLLPVALGIFSYRRWLEVRHEITERKHSEEELLEREERHRQISDLIADYAYSCIKPAGGAFAIDWSAGAVEKITGYTIEEIRRHGCWQFFVHPLDLPIFERNVIGLSPGDSTDCELRIVHKDGSIRWVKASSKVIEDSRNPLSHRLIGSLEEITERKCSDEALRESDERLRLTLEAVNDGVWDWNIPTGTAVFSPHWYTMLGYEPYEFPQNYDSWRRLVHPEDVVRAEREITEHLASGEGYAVEIRMRTKSGGWRWILTRGKVAERGTDGRPVRMLGTHSDITERKQADEEKEKLESQLRHAQKMEAMGTLAGGIAHDFKNILGIIMGYVELVRSTFSEESRNKRNLDEVLKACRRAKELVRQVLFFGRTESTIERGPINLPIVLNENLEFLRASLPSTIEIRSNITGKDLLAAANATQIQQVLTNLCTNAAHAMEERGGILEVNLTDVHFDPGAVLPQGDIKPGSWVKLTVRDNGHGMDAWTLERIFDPYFTTKEVGKGSGLGLSVVQGIVKEHEGTISVCSEPGKGATFDIYIPRIEIEATTEVEASNYLPKGTERILLVDDEIALADIGQMSLELLGYAVLAKTDSVEALELFRSQPEQFDLVITDYTMPRMTGVELAVEMIRIRQDIPVIICTGYNERISEERSRKVGICAFTMKPVNTRAMAETIRKVLETRKS